MNSKVTDYGAIGDALRAFVAAAGVNEKMKGDTSVDYHENDNRKIILPGLPERMDLKEASARLAALSAFEAQEFEINEVIPGMPLDAAHAFVQVIRARYGWAETKSATKRGFFGPIETAPEMHRVSTGVNPEDYIEVPMGNFELPDISAKVQTGFRRSRNNKSASEFYISATVKHKDRELILDLVRKTIEYLRANSIYKNKAMRLRVNADGKLEHLFEPEFISVNGVVEENLVHPRHTEMMLQNGLFNILRNTDKCRAHKIPLKRTVLLYGPYGTGKTLTANVAAKIGVAHGWTYITVDKPSGLSSALEFARNYQPAVVFCEDIDRSAEERSDETNELMNTINGVLKDGDEIMTVLTTNHIERIHPGMRRPGRIDMIIPVDLPDAEAAAKLVRVYGRSLVPADLCLDEASRIMNGFIPAAIREVVERAKLSMIVEDRIALNASDLVVAALGMKQHSDLSKPEEAAVSDAEMFGLTAQKLLGLNGKSEEIGKTLELVIDIHGNTV